VVNAKLQVAIWCVRAVCVKNNTFIFFHQLHVVDVSAHMVNEFLMDQDVFMYIISILN